MDRITDALGWDMGLWDEVAHIARCGSNIRITQRHITQINEDGTVYLDGPYEKRRKVKPSNLVKLHIEEN